MVLRYLKQCTTCTIPKIQDIIKENALILQHYVVLYSFYKKHVQMFSSEDVYSLFFSWVLVEI